MRAVIAVVVPARGAEAFAAALEPFAEAVSAFEAAPGGDWRIEAMAPRPIRRSWALPWRWPPPL
jgi:hypothetical protein